MMNYPTDLGCWDANPPIKMEQEVVLLAPQPYFVHTPYAFSGTSAQISPAHQQSTLLHQIENSHNNMTVCPTTPSYTPISVSVGCPRTAIPVAQPLVRPVRQDHYHALVTKELRSPLDSYRPLVAGTQTSPEPQFTPPLVRCVNSLCDGAVAPTLSVLNQFASINSLVVVSPFPHTPTRAALTYPEVIPRVGLGGMEADEEAAVAGLTVDALHQAPNVHSSPNVHPRIRKPISAPVDVVNTEGNVIEPSLADIAPCTHVSDWKRLRGKKGFGQYVCLQCGVKWKTSVSYLGLLTPSH